MRKFSLLVMLIITSLGTLCAKASELYVITGLGSTSDLKYYNGISVLDTDNPSELTMVYDEIEELKAGITETQLFTPLAVFVHTGNGNIKGYRPRRVIIGGLEDIQYLAWMSFKHEGDSWHFEYHKKDELKAAWDAYPNCMSYNPQDGKIYGTRKNYSLDPTGAVSDSWTDIYTIDPDHGYMTQVSRTPSTYYVNSIAFDARGNAFTTNSEGELYRLNVRTGELTYVGDTGIKSNDVTWSCVDYSTNILYLAVRNTIYEINTDDASVKKLVDLEIPLGSPIRGLFSMEKPKNVPSAISNLAVKYPTAGQLASNITFTVPTTNLDGSAISGTVDAKIYIDGVEETSLGKTGLAAGSQQTIPYTFASEGLHNVVVVLYKDNNEGGRSDIDTWAGFDIPKAPSDINLVINEDGTYRVNWSAVEDGIHGEAIDKSSLKYEAVWHPFLTEEKDINVTNLSGRINYEGYTAYYVSVKAVTDSQIGRTGDSNIVRYGEAIETPWFEDFTNKDSFALFDIYNIDNDATWTLVDYGDDRKGAMINLYASEIGADDWLVSPPLLMRKGVEYTVTHEAYGLYAFADEDLNRLEVYAGTSPDYNTMTRLYSPEEEEAGMTGVVGSYPGYGETNFPYTATEDGKLYIALHAASPAATGLLLSTLKVSSTAADAAPAAAENLEVIPGEKGALEATVSFNAPTKNGLGETLSTMKYVQVFRNSESVPAQIFNNVEPGAVLSFVDKVNKPGNHTYSIYSYNDYGHGVVSSKTQWIGEDLPGAVKDLEIYQKGDLVHVSWKAPDAVHNMWMDTDNLQYTVWFWLGEMEEPYEYISGHKDLEIDIPATDFIRYAQATGGQVGVEFYVAATSSAGMGQITGDYIYIGESYQLPFKESITNASMSTTPWTPTEVKGYGYQGGWYGCKTSSSKNPMPAVTAQDNDEGMFVFYQTTLPKYEERLHSPVISIEGEKDPAMFFYLYHNSGSTTAEKEAYNNTSLTIEVYTDGQYIAVSNPIKVNEDTGWTQHAVSLKDIDADEISISFHATGTNLSPLLMDNILIEAGHPEVETEYVLNPVQGLQGLVNEEQGQFFLHWPEVKYQNNITLLGYNVYCDDEVQNFDLITSTWYEFDSDPRGKGTYYVTAVYDKGESIKSNGVKDFVTTAVDVVFEQNAPAKVWGVQGAVIIESDNNAFSVYSMNGVCVAEGIVNGTERIALEKGIYMVRIGSKTIKCAVR